MSWSIALDVSSTHIGWVLAEDGQRRFSGTKALVGEIAHRCWQAEQFTRDLITTCCTNGGRPTQLALEAPGGEHKKGLIPQCRVSGGVLVACEAFGVPVIELSPTQGKKAIAGSGKAKKPDVMRAAAPTLGHDPRTLVFQQGAFFGRPTKSGDWRAWSSEGKVLFDEHEADAIALLVAAKSQS